MHTEGDDLLRTIRLYVTETVPPPLVDVTTELVARTVVRIMTTPSFYLHLTYVQELQTAILRLQTQNEALHRHIAELAPRQRRPSAPRKASKRPQASRTTPKPKSAPVAPPRAKKAAPRPQPRSRNGQFKRGASGR